MRSDVFKYLVNKIKGVVISALNFTLPTGFFEAEGFYTDQGVKFIDGKCFELKL